MECQAHERHYSGPEETFRHGLPVSRSRLHAQRRGEYPAEDRRDALRGLDEPGLFRRLVSNYYLSAGLLIFALNVLFYIAALTRSNLSVAYPIMVAGGIVIVVSVSACALQEAITPLQTVGLALLVLGTALVGHRGLA